jgi:rhodanese-related sulfurtransferase
MQTLCEAKASYMNRLAHQIQCLSAYMLIIPLLLINTAAQGGRYTSPDTIDGSITIDAEGLIELVDENETQIIIDSRISSDRKQGYIPGSISLPDTETDCVSLSGLIPEKTDPVVFYCNGPKCRRSDNAVVIALDCGYTNIYWFRGGIEAWRASNYPIAK